MFHKEGKVFATNYESLRRIIIVIVHRHESNQISYLRAKAKSQCFSSSHSSEVSMLVVGTVEPISVAQAVT